MSSRNQNSEEFENVQLDGQLHVLWEAVRESLDQFSTYLRSLRSHENLVISLCLCNGSRVDVYNIPETQSVFGMALKLQKANSGAEEFNENSYYPDQTNSALSTDGEISSLPSYSLAPVEHLGSKDLRVFFTALRRKMNMSTYSWPLAAQQSYIAITNKPIPIGPGRAHSGKRNLLLLLELSVRCDKGWNRAVREMICDMGEGEYNDTMKLSDQMLEQGELEGEQAVYDSHRKTSDDKQDTLNDRIQEFSAAEAVKMARLLPRDTLITRKVQSEWSSLSELVSKLRYPQVDFESGWYIQATPPDGNCLFSAVMTGANAMNVLPKEANTIASLRNMLRTGLGQLANAGRKGSPFRRDWLASCIYDLDDHDFEIMCRKGLDKALSSCSEKDIEAYLAPIRVYVSNWAAKVGGKHWGGLLRPELSILASITGCVIEVLDIVDKNISKDCSGVDTIEMCDTRHGNNLVTLTRRDLLFPINAALPSMVQRFLGPASDDDTRSGWVGPFSVIRVVLRGRHYNVCTSRYGLPIQGIRDDEIHPMGRRFNFARTLTEPYASLESTEEQVYNQALILINNWKEAEKISPEQGRHADSIVFQSDHGGIPVSLLSHLLTPSREDSSDSSYMMSDDIITSYMCLLERRGNALAKETGSMRIWGPPRCRYMDSWFYHTLRRGLSGPKARRKRDDLSRFDLILLPVLQDGHWVLSACYLRDGIIGVYDPFHVARHDVFVVVKAWAEIQLPTPDHGEWRFKDIREDRGCTQIGGIDCGLYVCKAAECLGLGFPIRISQWDMHYIRKRMVVEFLQQQATNICLGKQF